MPNRKVRAIKTTGYFKRKVRKDLRDMNGNEILLQRLTSEYYGGRLEFRHKDVRLKGKRVIVRGQYTLEAFGQSLKFGRATNGAGHRWVQTSIDIAFARLCCERIGIDVSKYFRRPSNAE